MNKKSSAVIESSFALSIDKKAISSRENVTDTTNYKERFKELQKKWDSTSLFSEKTTLIQTGIELLSPEDISLVFKADKKDTLFATKLLEKISRPLLLSHGTATAAVTGDLDLLHLVLEKAIPKEIEIAKHAASFRVIAFALFSKYIKLNSSQKELLEKTASFIDLVQKFRQLIHIPGKIWSWIKKTIFIELFHSLSDFSSSFGKKSPPSPPIQLLLNLLEVWKELPEFQMPKLPNPIFSSLSFEETFENLLAMEILDLKNPSLAQMALASSLFLHPSLFIKILPFVEINTPFAHSQLPSLFSFFFQDSFANRSLFPEYILPLHLAILGGKIEDVEETLRLGAHLKEANKTSDLLALAFLSCIWNEKEGEELVDRLMKETEVTGNEQTVLAAVRAGRVDWVMALVEEKKAPIIDKALFLAIKKADPEMVQTLLLLGAPLDGFDEMGLTLLETLFVNPSLTKENEAILSAIFTSKIENNDLSSEEVERLLRFALNFEEPALWQLVKKIPSDHPYFSDTFLLPPLPSFSLLRKETKKEKTFLEGIQILLHKEIDLFRLDEGKSLLFELAKLSGASAALLKRLKEKEIQRRPLIELLRKRGIRYTLKTFYYRIACLVLHR